MTRTTAAEYQALVAGELPENTLQAWVEGLARQLGWRFYHTHDSRRSVAGFPDLTLVRGPRLIFAELKRQKGRVSPDQKDWLTDLQQVPGIEVYLWRPADWYADTIAQVLEQGPVS